MTEVKCMYRCSDDTCASSLSEYHCQVVSDANCSECDRNQDKPFISNEQKLRSVIRAAFDAAVDIPGNNDVVKILSDGLNI
jgi:hypothetical protein